MKQRINNATLATAALLATALAIGCSTDSPTTPTPGSGTGVPPGNGTGSGSWSITVTAEPNTLELPATGSTDPIPTATVRINVRNASTGNPPPNGTTVLVTTTGTGTLTGFTDQCPTDNDPNAFCVPLFNGQATVTYNPTTTSLGTFVVRAQLEQSSGAASISVLQGGPPPPFSIDHVEPNIGDPSGGTRATIFGENFEGTVKVTFGGTNAQVLSVSPTQVKVIVPPAPSAVPVGSTLPVSVSVTNNFGTTEESSDSLSGAFIYSHGGTIEAPQVFSLTPTTGPIEGGTRITIRGSGFQSPMQVLFVFDNVQVEAPIESVASSQLVVRSPDIRNYLDAGTLQVPVAPASIRVINLTSGFSTTFPGTGQPGGFFYGSTMRITSIAPGTGPYQGGTQVVINGSGFDEPVAVSIGGIGQQVISVSGSQIIIRTVGLLNPPSCNGVTTGTVSVTNVEGGATVDGPEFAFTGPRSPTVLSIVPVSGGVGQAVTITGQNFPVQSQLRVLFGGSDGSSAPVTSSSSTSIGATVPTPPPGFAFNTVACDGNGDNIASGTRNVPTPISVTVLDLTTGCEGTLTNAFTLNPSDASCTGDTSSPPAPAAPVASFTAVPGAAATHTVQFTSTSTGTITSYLWSFGDATTSTLQNPSHNYAAAGPFSVTLTVTGPGGSDGDTQNIVAP